MGDREELERVGVDGIDGEALDGEVGYGLKGEAGGVDGDAGIDDRSDEALYEEFDDDDIGFGDDDVTYFDDEVGNDGFGGVNDGFGADDDDVGKVGGGETESVTGGSETGGSETGGSAAGESATSELIRELHLLGYAGDDPSTLARNIRERRESTLSEERLISNRDGKGHIRSLHRTAAMPSSSDGISERQVLLFSETAGCSRDESRRLLAKHARLMRGK